MVESKAAALLRELITRGTLPTDPTLGALADEASGQGLTSVLLAAIDEGRLPWARPLREALVAERRRVLVRTLGQVALAARVTTLLAARGIRALPLKGVAIVETVCDLEADRPMSDADLLVLERWPEGLGLLRDEGFVALARGDHAWALRDPGSGLVLELHRSVTSAPGLFPLDAEGLWMRRRPGRGQQPFLPSAEDLLVQLALHASFQHGFVLSLAQWLDFRRVLEREALDWAQLRALAETARADVALAAALLAAEAVVAARFPVALRPLVGRLPRGLRSWLEPRLAAPLGFVAPAPADLARVRWKLLAGRRAELLWRTLVLPEAADGDDRLPARLGLAARRAVRLALGGSRPAPVLPHEAHECRAPGDRTAADEDARTGDVDLDETALRELLTSFPEVRLTVTGRCMEPALAHGEKVRLVAPARRRPRIGDVVLAQQRNGLRLHRLVWRLPLVPGRWRTKADRGRLLDPPLAAADVLATVVEVEGRPEARLRRPGRALVSLAGAVLYRTRRGSRLSPTPR